jgi:chemotaxis protein methyltransferase CheR
MTRQRHSRPDLPILQRAEFDAFCDLFVERVGLQFTEASLASFQRRLGERLIEVGFDSFRDYHRYLQTEDPAGPEFQLALDAVTTAETYFFRQENQLKSFASEVVPRLHEELRSSRRLMIWSAGCSTGEEAYTLAILLAESGLFNDWEVRIVGSDLCRSRVDAARRGVYREASFRVTSDAVRKRHFEPHGDGWRVCGMAREMCHFNQLNLLEEGAAIGRAHVVFCRNVLIYFSESARGRVVDSLRRRLFPGGYLFLGHSESLVNAETDFEFVHLEGDLAYRKPPLSQRFR